MNLRIVYCACTNGKSTFRAAGARKKSTFYCKSSQNQQFLNGRGSFFSRWGFFFFERGSFFFRMKSEKKDPPNSDFQNEVENKPSKMTPLKGGGSYFHLPGSVKMRYLNGFLKKIGCIS